MRGQVMAQHLKEEQRQAIIEAARQELREKGYNDASMRSIAAKAEMTVGNLYRYFKNKEEIQEYIVANAREKIYAILRQQTVDSVSKEPRVFNIRPDTDELSAMLDRMADRLISIYENDTDEFLILLSDTAMNEYLISWYSRTVHALIDQHFLFDSQQEERDILTRTYAIAMHSGVKEIFKHDDLSIDRLRFLLQTYLHSFIVLLDSDLTRQKEGYSFYHIQTPEET